MAGMTLSPTRSHEETGMEGKILHFMARDEGAVTVDWVVLTGAIVGFGMLVLVPVAFGTDSAATRAGDYVENVPVGYRSAD
jgi:hypothetical protein